MVAITTKLNAAWTSLFGGGSTSTVYYPVGTDMAYILDVADNDVRTEGIFLCLYESVKEQH